MTITKIKAWLWLQSGDTLTSVDWAFMSAADGTGTTYASGTATGTFTFVESNGFGFDIYEVDIAVSWTPPSSGIFWLQLQNALSASSNSVYWDESDGASQGFITGFGSIPSETFQLLAGATVIWDNTNSSTFNNTAWPIDNIVDGTWVANSFLVPFPAACGTTDNLVGWWKFDEGSGTLTADSSGQGNDGTLTNGVAGSWSSSVAPSCCLPNPYCLDFGAAANSYSLVPNASSLVFAAGDQISFAYWVRLSSGSGGPVFGKVGLYSNLPGQNYNIGIGSSRASFYYDNAATGQVFSSSISLPVGSWVHIAFTYTFGTGSTAKWYVNGVLDTGASWTQGNGNVSPANVNVPVTLGNFVLSGTPQTALLGRLDDLRLYKGVILSAAQIKVLADTSCFSFSSSPSSLSSSRSSPLSSLARSSKPSTPLSSSAPSLSPSRSASSAPSGASSPSSPFSSRSSVPSPSSPQSSVGPSSQASSSSTPASPSPSPSGSSPGPSSAAPSSPLPSSLSSLAPSPSLSSAASRIASLLSSLGPSAGPSRGSSSAAPFSPAPRRPGAIILDTVYFKDILDVSNFIQTQEDAPNEPGTVIDNPNFP